MAAEPSAARWHDTTSVLLDIDGVIAVSWEPVPGAVDAVRAICGSGRPARFLTNTTSRPRREVADALRDLGVDVDDDDVLTAVRATASYLREHHRDARCLVLSSGDADDDLAGVERTTSASAAEVVVLGGAGAEFSYDRLNDVFSALDSGAAFVAMHRNLHWRTRDGDQLDTGAFVLGLETAAGVEATVTGKPSAAFYAAALGSLPAGRADAASTVMVGDDLHADVLGAQQHGLRGVLVRTGKYRGRDLDAAASAGEGRPGAVIDSVAELPALLGIG